ncbi:hypothetical protein [Streptomyces sp. NPDC127114]
MPTTPGPRSPLPALTPAVPGEDPVLPTEAEVARIAGAGRAPVVN